MTRIIAFNTRIGYGNRLHGTYFGPDRPGVTSGHEVVTSPIISTDGDKFTTRSGTVYRVQLAEGVEYTPAI